MISVKNIEFYGWEAAVKTAQIIGGEESDSFYCEEPNEKCMVCHVDNCYNGYIIGNNDLKLMEKFISVGNYNELMQKINVTMDVTAPLYWWEDFDIYQKNFDTYKAANFCSVIRKIHEKKFELNDFSHEHLDIRTRKKLEGIIDVLNDYRLKYINYNTYDFETKELPDKKLIWWQIIQFLPNSYNQERTIQLNYAALRNIYHTMKDHKLDEWRIFCNILEYFPFSDLITDAKE